MQKEEREEVQDDVDGHHFDDCYYHGVQKSAVWKLMIID